MTFNPNTPLSQIATVVSGTGFPSELQGRSDGEYPFYKVSDMNLPGNEVQMHHHNNAIDEATRRSLRAVVCPAGTIIFPKIGAAIATNKKRVLTKPACFDNNVMGICPGASVDAAYLFYWMQLIDLSSISNPGNPPSIRKTVVEDLQISLPPLNDQNRIVERLDKAAGVKANAEKTIAELDKLQQSVFLDMFGDPVTNSKRWIDTEELCDHATISSGITKGRRLREARVTPVPYLAVSNVQDQRIVLEHVKTIEATSEEIRRYALEKGDILLTEGGDPDKLGRGAIWEGQINPCIHQNHVFKVRLNSNVLRREFLSALLSSARGKRYFLRGAKHTTGIASINMSQLKKFPLLIPPLELQDTYAVFLDQLSTQRQILETQSAEMEMLFKSLLQRAFSRDI